MSILRKLKLWFKGYRKWYPYKEIGDMTPRWYYRGAHYDEDELPK